MFDEAGWNDEGAEEAVSSPALPPRSRPVQHRTPTGSLQKQRRQLLATLQRLEASSRMEPAQRPRPLSGDSESESEPESQVQRKQRRKQVLKAKAAASPHLTPGAPSGSKAGPEPDPAGRRQRKDSAAEAPGDRDPAPPNTQPSQSARGAAEVPGPLLSRKQWRNKQKNKRRRKNKYRVATAVGARQGPDAGVGQGPDAGVGQGPGTDAGAGQGASELSVALRARMEDRLHSARFRYINQQLYMSSSQEAAQLFQCDPGAFTIYHRGFAQQVGRWPENPVQHIIQYLRGRSASLVVADFGCGDGQIARSVRNKVHSFDLVALNPNVTVCDMAKVPLADESVDVAVFCLALMGTNLQEILEEANRVLKPGGTLKIAEVASRFADIRAFISAVTQLGFQIVSKDLDNHFFYIFDFKKTGRPQAGGALPGLLLKPCLYKKR